MQQKQEYYNLLVKYGIDDILKNIEYLSYSKKYNIIATLIEKYNAQKINKALYYFDQNYIQKERINLRAITNILKGICRLC